MIRSEFALQGLPELVDELSDLQADVEGQLKLQCNPGEIQIHIFRNRRNYENYVSVRVPDGLKRQALFVQGSDAGRIYVYRQFTPGAVEKLQTDVRHETTHALLHTALPYVPIWLDEGIAEYFEAAPGRRQRHNPHQNELKRAILLGWRPQIERLEAKRNLSDMEGSDYRDAWGIVHYMLHGSPAANAALTEYFKQIESGKVPTPLSQQLNQRIPNLEQSIVNHLR